MATDARPTRAVSRASNFIKRFAAQALCFLLIGAVINVVVAWVAVATGPHPVQNVFDRGWALDPPHEWRLVDPDVAPRKTSRDSSVLTVTNATGWVRCEGAEYGVIGHGCQYELAAGWPWRSLQRTVVCFQRMGAESMEPASMRPRSLGEGMRVAYLAEWAGADNSRACLPVVPLWPGLVGNTLVFAGAAFFLVWATGQNMRWTALRALGFLILGLLATAVVACVGIIWFPPQHRTTYDLFSTQAGDPRAPREMLDLVPSTWKTSGGETTPIVQHLAVARVCSIGLLERGFRFGRGDELVSISSGWPARCFIATDNKADWSDLSKLLRLYESSDVPAAPPPPEWRYAAPIPDWLRPSWADPLDLGPTARIIPLRPIPLGLAINTLVFAAALAMFAGTARAARRALRTHRRLCPNCAYPTSLSAVCSECGKPVKPRAGATP